MKKTNPKDRDRGGTNMSTLVLPSPHLQCLHACRSTYFVFEYSSGGLRLHLKTSFGCKVFLKKWSPPIPAKLAFLPPNFDFVLFGDIMLFFSFIKCAHVLFLFFTVLYWRKGGGGDLEIRSTKVQQCTATHLTGWSNWLFEAAKLEKQHGTCVSEASLALREKKNGSIICLIR